MTNENILKLAIEKAEKNGFYSDTHHFGNDEGLFDDEFYHIIFSHDFAISFYGKEWKKRLKEQVLEVNPLDYIKKYLD